MKRWPSVFLPVMVLATSCSVITGGGASGGGADPGGGGAVAPVEPDAAMRPDLIIADPTEVAPGEIVALTFPEETNRGVLFVLEVQVDGGWRPVAYLTSDGPGAGWERTWWPVAAAGMAVPDIGVGGPGPDRVVIPEVA